MSNEDKDEADEGSQSIFDLFEPPPEGGPSSFGKVPVVRGEEGSDSENAELSQKMADAEAEAAGLQHWTEPATGKMPAAFEATRSQRIEREALRPSWQGDDGGWDGPDLTEALESIDEMDDDLDLIADPVVETPEAVTTSDSLDTVQELGWDRDEPSPVVEPAESAVVDPSEGRLAPSPEPHTAPAPTAATTERVAGGESAVGSESPTGGVASTTSRVPVTGVESASTRNGGLSSRSFEPARSERDSDALATPTSAPTPEPVGRDLSSDATRVLQGTSVGEDALLREKTDDRLESRRVDETEKGRAAGAPSPPALRSRGDSSSDAPTAPGLFSDSSDDVGVFAADPPALDLTEPKEESPSAAPSPVRNEEYGRLVAEDKPGRNIPQAIAVGVALGAVVLVSMALGPVYILGVVALVALLAVVELYNAMRIAGLRPANLLGIFGAVALPLAAYYRGDSAFTLVFALSLVFGMLWYIVGADSERPVLNLSLTLLGVAWIGGLGAFAGLILRNDRGVQYLASTILMVVVFDTLAYFGGRAFGSRPFHRASPNKTWEGTLAGFIGSVFTGAALWATPLSFIDMWSNELVAALALGAAVGLAAPIGDLAESLVKRDLGIKDMGTILPGHGGVLDRIDGLLFALPTAYYLALSLRFVWQ